MKLALGPLRGNQFDTAIASLAPGTRDVGLLHAGNRISWRTVSKIKRDQLSTMRGIARIPEMWPEGYSKRKCHEGQAA